MLTERGTGLLGASVVLWVASRMFGVPELQMAALGTLALLTGALVYTRLTSTRLTVARTARPARLFAGHTGTVELVVRNVGRLPTANLDLRDEVPPTIAEGARLRLPPLAPGDRRTVSYRLHGNHRGRFALGPLTVRVRDPFGLAARERTLPGTAEVVIYPAVWTLPAGVPLGGAATSGGEGRPRPLPSGEELANVREYVRGDDLRTVHWPTTAHRGKLMVRQAEAPQDPRAVVLLDIRADRHAGHGPGASLETAVTATASVIHHLATNGRRVVLLDRPVAAPPVSLPWEGWLERLADIGVDDIDLGAVLQQFGRGSVGDGTLVAVLTLPQATELRDIVRAGRGFSSRLAVLVDAASHAGTPTPSADVTADALRGAGWRVTVVAAGDRIDERWRELALHRRTAGVGS